MRLSHLFSKIKNLPRIAATPEKITSHSPLPTELKLDIPFQSDGEQIVASKITEHPEGLGIPRGTSEMSLDIAPVPANFRSQSHAGNRFPVQPQGDIVVILPGRPYICTIGIPPLIRVEISNAGIASVLEPLKASTRRPLVVDRVVQVIDNRGPLPVNKSVGSTISPIPHFIDIPLDAEIMLDGPFPPAGKLAAVHEAVVRAVSVSVR